MNAIMAFKKTHFYRNIAKQKMARAGHVFRFK